MIVRPFRGLRPRADLASRIPSLPYDVVSTDEARELTRDDPYSFLHVVRPEVDLPVSIDPHDDRVYEQGRARLRSMLDEGWLAQDARPAYYVYRLRSGEHVQTGVVGAVAVDDYLTGKIKRHELTRSDKEQDRAKLVDALGAHPGPVFLTHRRQAALAALVATVTERNPAVSFTAVDGIGHELWVVEDRAIAGDIEAAFTDLPCTYIADGHHRAAAAATVCRERRARRGSSKGTEPASYFLAVHFPSDELRVLDYNRVVRDLNGLAPSAVLSRVREAGFEVRTPHAARRPPRRGSYGVFLAETWHLLEASPSWLRGNDILAALDVSILTDRVLQPILGIGDPRTDPRIDFVGGIRGMDELERRVREGKAAIACALFPTSLEDVMRVADAGHVMPPKSTWFEPKLRSGMVVLSMEGEEL